MKTNLLNFNRPQLEKFFTDIGEKPFRAQQLLQWIHKYGVTDFAAMSNVQKGLREKLAEIAEIKVPEIAYEKVSNDGTIKWLLRLDDGNCIETVFIPEKERGTLCVSSQVGCILNCSFCSTGKQGFSRNLTTAEIIGQVWIAARALAKLNPEKKRNLTNVVMMGMGEPLLNFEPMVAALDLMLDDLTYQLSKNRVTVSTSGVIPQMLELKKRSPVCLAVSLHAPNDELRNILVPLNKKYRLKELMAVCRDYFKEDSRRVVMFEYVMLDGVNDTPEHARELVKLLKDVPCKVNLIPFNPFPNTEYRRSSDLAIETFQKILAGAGITTLVRRTRGDDVDAACGQLVGEVQDKTERVIRLQKKQRRD